jgi:ABC-type cobalamin/Fe3+-siderophores transport system ATPase subunit
MRGSAALAIPGGYVVALVGPNGAGKTTLLHMSVGLTRPTAGRITVLGSERRVAGAPARAPACARSSRLRTPAGRFEPPRTRSGPG